MPLNNRPMEIEKRGTEAHGLCMSLGRPLVRGRLAGSMYRKCGSDSRQASAGAAAKSSDGRPQIACAFGPQAIRLYGE